ncbi:bifunctional UDP-2,4-diacetamido-2,4,6-trideoxy-beta-L-altropyranose hydrolase/GNAT family N-acetyltransferase [Isachenkonia alkalipeptolytica]|uniref:GNAT family N-acetyltransferase n=1 Tax=Isachenkonia alkalipeptolytica TaxID=2565777 RepID=A0AA43XMG1_9CLOT|nr:bifunctional UDP-2,4-diacetamido-2,4,6-trideoxy-beta-L-altropyranose hydrolase/GNAT family N-acetyltransferase [Isachenkonia alkalipeptolytica]NBG89528.1 GNAT family N-acetyltransferase [Isachenkonia alkalipeptolytica]
MKIKIFTEGGKDIGLGHISRCSSLYNEAASRGISVDLIVYGDIVDVDFLNGINIINENWLDKEYLYNNITSDDYAIVDSYEATKEIYDIISKKTKKVLYIDDIGRTVYPEGIIVNPSLDASHIDYSKSQNGILLSGPEYVILRKQFRSLKKENISKEVKRVLIMMGGTDIRGLTPLIIDNICRNMLDIEFDIVTGSEEMEKINSQISKPKNITFHNNLDATQMMELMISCDLAITAAGQTIYELLATQTPFIPIKVIENQENNIKSLFEYNPEQIVLRYDDLDFLSNLNKALEIYSDIEYRKSYNQRYKDLVDGYGSKRIVDYLLKDKNKEYKINLRKIKSEDIKEVFDLSNQDYVRRYSINKDKIEWADHIKWFNSVLEDKSTVFYVVTDKNESFLGQIRYKIAQNSATVSISLSEKLKGKGLSKEILSKSIKKIFEEEQSVKDIIAFVSENNIASKKIFEGLNFKRVKDEDSMMKLILKKEDFYVN